MSNSQNSSISSDLEVNPGSPRESLFSNANIFAKRGDNPYLKYLIKLRLAAAEAGRGKSLDCKSEEVTTTIIRNFLKWYNSLGGASNERTIYEEMLQDLFRVGFDSPKRPDMSAEVSVQNGTYELQMKNETTSSRPKSRWMKTDEDSGYVTKAPSDLQDLSKVWEGIETLWSTIAFSSWLQKHPGIDPPSYLKQCGLVNLNFTSLIFRSEELGGESALSAAGEQRLLVPPMEKQTFANDSDASRHPIFGRSCKCPRRNNAIQQSAVMHSWGKRV